LQEQIEQIQFLLSILHTTITITINLQQRSLIQNAYPENSEIGKLDVVLLKQRFSQYACLNL
jgi:hypothetical protein